MKSQHFNIYLAVAATLSTMMTATDASSQSVQSNYIATERILNADGTAVKSVQYYDAYGRADQLAAGGMNTTGNYVYSATEYDALGNVSRTWLPSAGGTSPDHADAQSVSAYSNETYGSGVYAFSDMTHDALGRVTFSSTPGNEWVTAGKGVAESYFTNAANSVRLIELQNGCPVLSGTACYPAGTLHGSSVTDEDGHRIDVYRDVSGNTVLERRYDGSSAPNDTYYIYEHGLLHAVVPMKCLITGDTLYSYRYSYDSFGRCIRKSLPGGISTRYWYDRYGRLSFLQDERLSQAMEYRFFLYDALGRLAVQGRTGTLISGSGYEARVVTGSPDQALAGTGYAQTSIPAIMDCELEHVNYYDGYSCLQTPLFTSVTSTAALPSGNGSYSQSLLTAQMVSDMNGAQLFRVLYYDWQGRCTETRTTYLEDVMLKKRYRYSYSGRTTSETTSLYKLGILRHTVTDSIRYHAGSDLPIAELLSVDSHPFITVSMTEYDNLGRVSSRQEFGEAITEEYSYDVHGSLARHNAKLAQNQQMYLLDENLYYASGPGTPCYNGNISAMRDCLLSPGIDLFYTGYTYSYDGMDRLLCATSRSGSNLNMAPTVDTSERMEYDVDSSIKKLVRRGKSHTGPRTIDSLTLGHTYGHLDTIVEHAPTNLLTGSFEISRQGTFLLSYDGSGSLSSDSYRQIDDIRYDRCGNPAFVAFTGGNETEYGYTADGVKLWTVHRTAAGTITPAILSMTKPKPAPEIGSTPSNYSRLTDQLIQSVDVTRYYDAFEFDDAALSEGKFYFGGGYVSFHTGGIVDYSAIISDYRGSTRVVVGMGSDCSHALVTQANGYYPSGALLSDLQALFLPASATTADVQTRKFTGKELDRMHGLDWHDFGARRYDAATATFTQMDPLCEKYYHVSPYAYCAGNPIMFVDPDGRKPRVYIETQGLGHAFVTTGEGESTVVYTYGRYGALGSFGSVLHKYTPTGEGILKRYSGTKANRYIAEEIKKEGFSVFEIENATDQDVASYYDELWATGIESIVNHEPEAKVIDKYNILKNNCTTKTIQGINGDQKSEIIPSVTETVRYDSQGLPYKGAKRIIAPAELKNELSEISQRHPDVIRKVDDTQEFIEGLLQELK